MQALTASDKVRTVTIGIERYCVLVSRWADNYPAVRRVWLYGSRVVGTCRADSDLDVAVELDDRALRGEKHFVWWMYESPAMKAVLAGMIDVVPHIQLYEPDAIEVISGVAEHGLLVYDARCK